MKKKLLALLLSLCLLCATLSLTALAEIAAEDTVATVIGDGTSEGTAGEVQDEAATSETPESPKGAENQDGRGETQETPGGTEKPNGESESSEETPEGTETPGGETEAPEPPKNAEMRIKVDQLGDSYDWSDMTARVEALPPVTVPLDPTFAATLQADDYFKIVYRYSAGEVSSSGEIKPWQMRLDKMMSVDVQVVLVKSENESYIYGSEKFPRSALTEPVVTLCYPLPNAFKDCDWVGGTLWTGNPPTAVQNPQPTKWDQIDCCMYFTADLADYGEFSYLNVYGSIIAVAEPDAAKVNSDIPAVLQDTAQALAQDVSKVDRPQIEPDKSITDSLQVGERVALDYTLEEMKANEDGTVTSFTMQVKPVVRHADGSTDVIANDKLTNAVIFQIPVPAKMAQAFDRFTVKHDGTAMAGDFTVSQNDSLYFIEVTTDSFSRFEVSGVSTTPPPATPEPSTKPEGTVPSTAPTSPATTGVASNVPQTSGDTHSALWLMLAVLPIGGLGALGLGRKRRSGSK